jgi:hypothetical protein
LRGFSRYAAARSLLFSRRTPDEAARLEARLRLEWEWLARVRRRAAGAEDERALRQVRGPVSKSTCTAPT